MSTISHHAIARRAYDKWEHEGRPDGRADVHWHAAESELIAETPDQSGDPDSSGTTEEILHIKEGPEITNLERRLSPGDRRKARARRHPQSDSNTHEVPRFVTVMDRGHLRIYQSVKAPGSRPERLVLEHAVDFVTGRETYTAAESDQAGRFADSRGAAGNGAAQTGASIDERLPLKREHDRRSVDLIATSLGAFLRRNPDAIWDFVAPPELHSAIFVRLPEDVQERVDVMCSKDLVNSPLEDLRARIAAARDGDG